MERIKWKCFRCGKERIMNPNVVLVLCNCNYKNMTRIGNLKQLGKASDGATQQILFGSKKKKKEEEELIEEIKINEYDPDAEDIID